MLTSAREHYRRQQELTAAAVLEARRQRTQAGLVRLIALYQLQAITITLESTPAELSEQGLRADPEARLNAAALLTAPEATAAMLSRLANRDALDRLVSTLVVDAARTSGTVDMARRPALTGYVRSLNLPSCSRCVVLAGRVYRYSTGFRRHPRCDCLMTPTTQAVGAELVTDPMDAFERGMVRGLSKADTQAVAEYGADLSQVVNVRRSGAGLTVGSSVHARGRRLTPEGILARSDSREQALELLQRHRYLS